MDRRTVVLGLVIALAIPPSGCLDQGQDRSQEKHTDCTVRYGWASGGLFEDVRALAQEANDSTGSNVSVHLPAEGQPDPPAGPFEDGDAVALVGVSWTGDGGPHALEDPREAVLATFLPEEAGADAPVVRARLAGAHGEASVRAVFEAFVGNVTAGTTESLEELSEAFWETREPTGSGAEGRLHRYELTVEGDWSFEQVFAGFEQPRVDPWAAGQMELEHGAWSAIVELGTLRIEGAHAAGQVDLTIDALDRLAATVNASEPLPLASVPSLLEETLASVGVRDVPDSPRVTQELCGDPRIDVQPP